jgi:hypothetical protein
MRRQWKLHEPVGTRRSHVHGTDDTGGIFMNDTPGIGRQDDEAERDAGEIVLVAHVLIASHHDIETGMVS